MKYSILLILIIFSLFTFSCSDDSPSDQDPIIGTWSGEGTQSGFGTFSVDITISNITQGEISGVLFSEVTAWDNCDPEVESCDALPCSTTWTYQGRDGNNYNFSATVPAVSNCINGNVEAQLMGENMLTFSFFTLDTNEKLTTSTVTRQ